MPTMGAILKWEVETMKPTKKVEAAEEKKEKPKKARKPITKEQIGKWGKREIRFSAKIGKMLVEETDAKRAEQLRSIATALSNAGATLLVLSK
jgi:hypothetical protein